MAVFVLISVLFGLTTEQVRAAQKPRSQTYSVCNPAGSYPGDVEYFPFGFMCGTHPDMHDQMVLEIFNKTTGLPVNNGDDVTGGDVLAITAHFDGVTGPPKKQYGSTAGGVDGLSFVTIDTHSNDAFGAIHPTNIGANSGVTGNSFHGCPGVGSLNIDGSPGPGKVWGNRDITGSYASTTAQNGDNQSPVAYDPTDTSGKGVINCGSTGRMVYWDDPNLTTTETYSFDLRTDNDFSSSSLSDICVRFDLSIPFDGDASLFPAPIGVDIVPVDGLANGKITATHIVKQSRGGAHCFNIKKPASLVDHWGQRLTFKCDRISGYITKYNGSGSVILDGSGNRITTNFTLQYRDPGSGLWRNITNPSSPPSTNTSSYFELPAPWYYNNITGAQLFGDGTYDLEFRLNVIGSPFTQFSIYAGTGIDCIPHQPTIVSAASCVDSVITGTARDKDATTQSITIEAYIPGSPNPFASTQADSSGNFTISIAGFQDGYDHTFTVVARDVPGPGGSAPDTAVSASMVGCGQFVLSPVANGDFDTADPESASSFSTNNLVNTTYPGWSNPARPSVSSIYSQDITKNFITVAGPSGSNDSYSSINTYPALTTSTVPMVPGTQYCSNIRVGQVGSTTLGAEGIIRRDGLILKITKDQSSSQDCNTVHNKPYFRTYGAGVLAGGEFQSIDNSCGASTPGTLASWNDNTGTFPVGSGTLLSALSTGQIIGFGSSQRGGDVADRLTFANKGTPPENSTPSPRIGGGFSASEGHCLPDVDVPNGTPTVASPGSVSIASQVGTAHKYTGDLTINGGTLGVGDKTTIVVEGNVYINGSITFSGSWSNSDQVPAVVIKADGGNIYIDPGVTELSGLYIAKKDSAGNTGKIYTCATAGGPITSGEYNTCHNQLLVHGSFVADQVNLMRTLGSMRDEKGTTGGSLLGLSWSCGPAGPTSPCSSPVGSNCVNINETADPTPGPYPYSWADNNLCAPAGVTLKWYRNTGILYNQQPIMNAAHPGEFCTPFNVPGEISAWQSDWLCSNKNLAFTYGGAGSCPLGMTVSTQIYEDADSHAGNIWHRDQNKTYLCEPTPSAAVPATRPFTCSNSGAIAFGRLKPSPYTCAAEVFDFSPDLYISNPLINSASGGAQTYDAITSLPPVL